MSKKPVYKNEVTLTLRISNDYGERKAIRQVSDKMITIAAYKTFGYDFTTHQKDQSMNFYVMIFTNKAKEKTNITFTKDNFPKPGDFIDVTGKIFTCGYTDKNGAKHTEYRILATDVTFSEMKEVEDNEYEDLDVLWNN